MKEFIKEVSKGKRGSRDLTYQEAVKVAERITSRKATDAQIAAFLISERIKSESADELLAFITEFNKSTDKLNLPNDIAESLIDFAGPYNGRNSFLATIPVSILMAERGVPVFLHSSDHLPPKYGTSIKSVLSRLGVKVDLPKESVTNSIIKYNIGFACTEFYCKPLKGLRKIREELHVRTMFNTIEKLLNISNAKSIMLGAFHKTAINKMTPIFKKLPFQTSFIVQGIEGSEDLPLHRNSFIYKIFDGEVLPEIVRPKDYGVQKNESEFEKKLSLDEQVNMILSILSGIEEKEQDYYRLQVIFNTGLRYYLFNYVSSVKEGMEIAHDQLKTGCGMRHLEKWSDV